MDTKVSAKGNVMLPTSFRRHLGIKAGDELTAELRDEGILLSPKTKAKRKKRVESHIVTSPVTGLPVLSAGDDAPVLTSEMVREMLADFP